MPERNCHTPAGAQHVSPCSPPFIRVSQTVGVKVTSKTILQKKYTWQGRVPSFFPLGVFQPKSPPHMRGYYFPHSTWQILIDPRALSFRLEMKIKGEALPGRWANVHGYPGRVYREDKAILFAS